MSDFLFAKPSVASGVARILDVFGVLQFYNYSETEEEADSIAIYNDFYLVGKDIDNALSQESTKEKVNA